MCYSNTGFGSMSREYHNVYRENLMRSKWADKCRPILINNWEATYFDFDEEKLLELANKAKEIGVEIFVLDDGWFGKRNMTDMPCLRYNHKYILGFYRIMSEITSAFPDILFEGCSGGGGRFDPGVCNLTYTKDVLFADFMVTWLENHRRNIRNSTYQDYKMRIESCIVPYFSKLGVTLTNLTPLMIDNYYTYLMKKNLSANTVKHHHANIRKALQYAYQHDMIVTNPADKVDLPKVKPYEARTFTLEEINKILEAVRNTVIEPCVILGIYYGLPQIKFHSLRHSFATVLANSNSISLTTLQVMLGHSTLDMTRKYIHTDMNEKIKAGMVINEMLKQNLW